jgi:uncharacterized membrane protein YgcG
MVQLSAGITNPLTRLMQTSLNPIVNCALLHLLYLLTLQVTDWLDYVLGKSDQPPSFMRREGPPERKRKKKQGEGSGRGGGGSSSRGTPPAGLAAAGGGGSARAVFGGGGPRPGPFGQVGGGLAAL